MNLSTHPSRPLSILYPLVRYLQSTHPSVHHSCTCSAVGSHSHQPISIHQSTGLLSAPHVLISQFIHFSSHLFSQSFIYPLSPHPTFTCSSSHSSIYPLSLFTIHLLVIFIFDHLFTYFLLTHVPTHLPNHPSIHLSTHHHPPSHHPFNHTTACLPIFSYSLHFSVAHPLTYSTVTTFS